MKKITAVLMALIMLGVLFISLGVCASAAYNPSPVASTYVDHDERTRNRTGRFTTKKRTTGVHGGDHSYEDERDDPNSPNYTGKRKTTKNYGDNEGKDDPNSPNYTGNRVPTSDKSSHSPDTASSLDGFGAVAVAIVLCTTVAGVASVKSKKSEN